MSDKFTKSRFAWQHQVLADHELPASALHVVIAISSHVNRETGEAFCGQARIAELCGLSRSGVRKAIAALVDRGHLNVIHTGRGRSTRSIYSWIIRQENAHSSAHNEEENAHSSNPFTQENAHSSDPINYENAHSEANKTRTGVTTNSMKDNSLSREYISPLPPSCDADQFELFWAMYPKRMDKGRSRSSWRRATRKADPQTILAGLRRYAASREGEPERFTKAPANWLDGECWTDDPPIVGNHQSQKQQQSTDVGQIWNVLRSARQEEEAWQ